jgi:hypothetical protein
MSIYDTMEGVRLVMNQQKKGNWNRWGPYVAERAWGTVRDDYSADGDAWGFFPHDHARSRAYRWNEDGLAAICDRHQYMCFGLAFWNGKDPILKERLFGLTGPEGNHGEDVKEYYFYLDNIPSHAYMKYLYKYPQSKYPYDELLQENARRTRLDMEYELVDTGIFNESKYFDVEIEYGKVSAEDLLIQISISNRGPEAAVIDVLPTLWFRNTWSWGRDDRRPTVKRHSGVAKDDRHQRMLAAHWQLGDYILYCEGCDELLFTENETNAERIFAQKSASPYVKDAFHEYVVDGKPETVNPRSTGTKAAARYHRTIAEGESIQIHLRLALVIDHHVLEDPFADFEASLKQRKEEADEFYNEILPPHLADDARMIARQAFAGMLWSKQYYHYVVTDWLNGDPSEPEPPPERLEGRNHDWRHLFTRDVLSMPDKWEFPWFASWDMGFHCITLAHIDPQFAKDQLILLLREWYMHPNGQVPAYEWDFSSVNPPILMLAARAVFDTDLKNTGVADYPFIERVFQKLLLNFTWWVNRKDITGKNIFQGGFLGMDNIGVFDRDKLPPGYLLGQADGTSWMAAYAKSMLSTALLLAEKDPTYEDLASKFWEHFIFIAHALNNRHDASKSLWDDEDGFFYDQLSIDDKEPIKIRARTMVGFVPMFGASTVPASTFDQYPAFQNRRDWFIKHRPDLIDCAGPAVVPGPSNRLILGLVRTEQLQRMLRYMLDESEFLSPYGVRAVSQYHRDHPLILHLDGQEYRLDYEPGESMTNLFGGNSNWRGPVWMPVNMLIIAALKEYHNYYGDEFVVECPTGSGQMMNLGQVADELRQRLVHIFVRDDQGRRAVFGDCELFHHDPHWKDLIPFHEYFHGDTGRGCGASHQTGWTGLISLLLMDQSKESELLT